MATKLRAAGKRFLGNTGLAVGLAVVACASTPAYLPPDDYEQYPKYKKESALYKIGRIFEQDCSVIKLTGEKKEYEVSPARLSCQQEHCTLYHIGSQADPLRPGRTIYINECAGPMEPLGFNLLWSEVVSPRLVVCEDGTLSCLKFSTDSRDHDFHALGPEQAEGLRKAIEVYLTP